MKGITKNYIAILNVVIPTLLFYIIYKFFGVNIAIVISTIYSVAVVIYRICANKKIYNTQIIGVIGLVVAYISILFTQNEKYYYLPSLISNCIYAVTVLILALKKKSVVHFVAKDFNFSGMKSIKETSLLTLNFIWLAYFFLKALSKGLGIVYLDFDTLYWLVFLLGDPAMIVICLYSYLYIKKRLQPVK